MKQRIAALVCMIAIIFLFCVPVGAESISEAAGEWTASAQNGVITVRYSDGREQAVLAYEKDEFVPDLLIAQDYNFDGRTDIAALTEMGTVNTRFSVWLDTQEGFAFCEELSDICAPFPDPLSGRVESYERAGAAQYIEKSYAWVEESLELMLMRETEYQTDGTVLVTEHTYRGGESIRLRTFAEAEWTQVQTGEQTCLQILHKLQGGADAQRMCSYEGLCMLDGESYYAYAVKENYEVLYVMYVSANDPSDVRIDAESDGIVSPEQYTASK